MNKLKKEGFKLIGIKLPHKTTNKADQSSIDCGDLWQKFETENCIEKIPKKLGNKIYAVYYDYEGDYTEPFSYFIGCRVEKDAEKPLNMDELIIPEGNYSEMIAKGKMPDCISDAWQEIWSSDIKRAYQFDFEVYGEQSKDWNEAKISIFISTK